MNAVNTQPLLSWLLTTEQQKQCLELLHPQCKFDELPSQIATQWDFLFKDKSAEMSTKCELLYSALKSLPLATITLAFHPTYNQLCEYVTLLRAHLDEQLIAEVNVDESIIAGCKVSFNGQEFSSTLASNLSERLKQL